MGLLNLFPVIYLATTSAVWLPSSGPVRSNSVNDERCLCSERPTVVNRLDPEHLGVERLVIFAYRKPNSNEIVTFIPDKDYQRKIPDLPERYGRADNIAQHPHIKDIFENSPHIHKRERDRFDKHYRPNDPDRPDNQPQPENNDFNQNDNEGDNEKPNNINLNGPDFDSGTPKWQMPLDETNGNIYKPHVNSYPPGQNDPQPENNDFNQNDNEGDNEKPNNINLNGPDFDSGTPKWQIPLDETNGNIYKPHVNSYPPGQNDNKNIKPEVDHIEFPVYNTEHHNTDDSTIVATPKYPNGNPNSHEDYPNSEKPLLNDDPQDFNNYPINSNSHTIEGHNLNDEGYIDHAIPEEIELNRNKEHSSDNPRPLIQENVNFPISDDHHKATDKENILPNKFPTNKKIKLSRIDKYGGLIGWNANNMKNYWNQNTPLRVHRYGPLNYHKYYQNRDPAFNYWLKQQLQNPTLSGNRIPTSNSDIIALDTAIRNVLLQNGWIVTARGNLIDGHGKTSSLNNLKLRPILVGKSFSYDRFIRQQRTDLKFKTNKPFLEGLLLTMIKPAKILGIVPLSITSVPQKRPRKLNRKDVTHSSGISRIGPKNERAFLKVLPIEDLVAFRNNLRRQKAKVAPTYIGPKQLNLQMSRSKKADDALLQQALSQLQGKEQTRDKGLNEEDHDRQTSKEEPDWRIIGGISATVSGTPLILKGRSGLGT